jgi:phage-related baseplate assembly protein
MAISWQSFTGFVSNTVAAVQASANAVIDATTGSVTLALAQAVSGVALWLQAYIIQVLLLTRAATSNNSDLDTFMADFGLARIPATFSKQTATFGSYSYTVQRQIPLGALISTGPGGIQFAVTADPTNPDWNVVLQSYVVPANTQNVTVPIQAVVAGSSGNVISGTVTSFVSPITFIDYVSNTAPSPQTGFDAETDPAFRQRFVQFFASLSKATKAAVGFAIASVQQGLTYSITENQNYAGATQLGYFYAVVNDGSGNPPSSLLSEIASAVDAVRPLTSTFNVYGTSIISINVSAAIVSAPGFTHSLVVAAAVTAVQNFLSTYPQGTSLPFGAVSAVLFGVTGVQNVANLLVNGATADITLTNQQTVEPGTIALT